MKSNMKILDIVDQHLTDLCCAYCGFHKLFGIFISFDQTLFCKESSVNELKLACPPLDVLLNDNDFTISISANGSLYTGKGLLLFETREDMKNAYESIVGDDGPTSTNPYNGNIKVYALTINSEGKTENENT